MVEAKDLRIGNWFYDGMVDKYGKLKPALVRRLDDEAPEDTFAEGIPLTTDILEKCGFVWETEKKTHLELILPDDGLHEKRIGFYYKDGNCEEFQMYSDDYFDGMVCIKPPASLHQLQNLYYWLTGKELEVNLL